VIDWLVKQVTTLASRISSLASDALKWAINEASDAYSRAYAKVLYYYDKAKSWTNSMVAAAEETSRKLWNDLKVWTIAGLDKAAKAAEQLVWIAKYELFNALDKASVAARQLIQIAEYELFDALNKASISARQLIDVGNIELSRRIDVLAKSIPPLADTIGAWMPLIDDLTKIFTTDGKTKITDFINRLYGMVNSFFENPVGMVAAFVGSFFVTMLCDLVAHGLGTVKYTLPAQQTYGVGGSGGPYVIGVGPPPGASGLAPPVSPLYVSGYRFGPGHPGIDLGIHMGQAIYAMHSGTVLQAGWTTVGYGFDVVLEGGGWWTRYAHLQQPLVSKGDKVRQSQQIALGDTTGNSTGPHLHLEIKWQGKFIDPATVLGV
jgi:murein DD-endopeptidase MepM/ murein hydrolase activator NlpD